MRGQTRRRREGRRGVAARLGFTSVSAVHFGSRSRVPRDRRDPGSVRLSAADARALGGTASALRLLPCAFRGGSTTRRRCWRRPLARSPCAASCGTDSAAREALFIARRFPLRLRVRLNTASPLFFFLTILLCFFVLIWLMLFCIVCFGVLFPYFRFVYFSFPCKRGSCFFFFFCYEFWIMLFFPPAFLCSPSPFHFASNEVHAIRRTDRRRGMRRTSAVPVPIAVPVAKHLHRAWEIDSRYGLAWSRR